MGILPYTSMAWRHYVEAAPNDEVERRGVAPTSNEADLSQSLILSMAYRSSDPRDRPNRLLDSSWYAGYRGSAWPLWKERRQPRSKATTESRARLLCDAVGIRQQ